ncbi:MAG TPA: DUF2490 domain-containing protein [Gemmatimonadaceae bacterium]|nr:DUF2490 domain-containing protein [Gemmatimonadaceae bacterium]
MSRTARRVGVVTALSCLFAAAARAQSTENEWWNELDMYWTAPSAKWRLFGMSQEARGIETTDRQLTLGLHVDDLEIPWGFARVGFRTIRSIGGSSAPEDRALAEVVAPSTKGRVRFRNRVRLELRWIGGEPSQRWRYRAQIEDHIRLPAKRELMPYATSELYWDSRYHALSRTAYRLGSTVTIVQHWVFDLSYARQDNRFGSPRHVNALWSRLEISY